jgi:hypothetical protein
LSESVIIESSIPPIDADDSTPGVDGDTDPEAPYGRRKDGTPAKRRGRQPGSTATGTRRAKVSLNQDELAQQIIEMSIPMAFFSPLASAVIDERADRTAKALITLAQNSPRFAKGLATFVSGSAYAELVFLPIGILTAVMVDYGRMSHESFLARKFNIDVHYNTFMMTQTRITNDPGSNVGGNGTGHFEGVDSRSGLV